MYSAATSISPDAAWVDRPVSITCVSPRSRGLPCRGGRSRKSGWRTRGPYRAQNWFDPFSEVGSRRQSGVLLLPRLRPPLLARACSALADTPSYRRAGQRCCLLAGLLSLVGADDEDHV